MFRGFMNTLTIVILAGFLWTLQAFGQENGKVTGILVDAENGDPLIGANVVLDGTSMGAASSLDGSYVIPRVPAGVYTLKVSYVSYQETRVSNVRVVPGQVTRVDVSIKPESIQGEEVVVEARLIQNNESSLLKSRQMAVAVSDAISSEAISRAGTGDAAGAMTKVTGASVVGGKYVFVRGLGDRYSSTQMNGVELPSSDPDKKAFQLDLIPSNLLDNITTIKTFTPDKPGSFSGGLVDVNTKTYPDKLTVKATMGSSVNSLTTFNDNYLSYAGGSTNFFGTHNGERDVPSDLEDVGTRIPSAQEARSNSEKAYQLDAISKSFKTSMVPLRRTAPINQNFSLSIGDQLQPTDDTRVGYAASFTYGHKYAYYDKGATGKWELNGTVADAAALSKRQFFSDSKGSDEVSWGGLGTLSYEFATPSLWSSRHELTANYFFSQSGESVARYQVGNWPESLSSEDALYETRSLLYTERHLGSFQLKGEHRLKQLLKMSLEWVAVVSNTSQDEPDLRYFSNDYSYDPDSETYSYDINTNIYSAPTRFFRDLNEDNRNFSLHATLPLSLSGPPNGKLKFGGTLSVTNRSFRERRFELIQQMSQYNGNPDDLFSEIGIVDSTNGRYFFGSYVRDASTDKSNYDGSQDITAWYAMLDVPILSRFRIVTGARMERTEMDAISLDSAQASGHLKNTDFLPSMNLIYQLRDNMNVRVSYGRTLARPTFRELAPYATFEYIGDFVYVGNPNLKRTLIDNYDLRWEYFIRPGELGAVSVFYKYLRNPIERTFNLGNEQYSVQNVKQGYVLGAEFEYRQRLDRVGESLKDFQIGFNLSVVQSEVAIPDSEYVNSIKPFNPSASSTRPLFGQSPYIVNVDLGYENSRTHTSANVQYSVFGRRLSDVTVGATPDIFEQPRHDITLTASQRLWRNVDAKLTIRNILGSEVRKSAEFKGREYTYQRYGTGRTFGVAISYTL